jgi:hypothetical protein
MPRRWLYAVCYEAPNSRPPETLRGEVVAGTSYTACSRAIKQANAEKTTRGFTSLVVLLEPVGAADEEA